MVTRNGSRHRAGHVCGGSDAIPGCGGRTALVEGLEQRVMLSDATIKIPVFNYHRVLPPLPEPPPAMLPLEYRFGHNIPLAQFTAHLEALAARNFVSLTPRNYLAWVNGAPMRVGLDEHVLRAGEHPFMAVFDDANKSELRVAELMKPYNFTGVAAVMTQDDPALLAGDRGPDAIQYYVGNVDQGFMTWADIRELATEHRWEIASHSWDHARLGDGSPKDVPGRRGGTAKPRDWFRNTPEQLDAQFFQSKRDIVEHVFDGDARRAPVAFFHPFHDVTRRTLAAASEHFPLVFGPAFSTEDPANPPQFVGRTSNPRNGELVRIAIGTETTIDGFTAALDLARADTPFVRPTFVQRDIPAAYVASDGTVVATGSDGNDAIALDGETVSLPLWDQRRRRLTQQVISLSGLRANQYAPAPTVRAVDLHGGHGNDTICINSPHPAAPVALSGGAGDDSLFGGAGDDRLYGNAGNDFMRGGAGNDLLNGGAGRDRMWGQDGNDRLYGRSGNDALDGGPGRDRLWGDDGNDKLFGRDTEADALDGGGGDDQGQIDIRVDETDELEHLLT